jgi:hypothetical protein
MGKLGTCFFGIPEGIIILEGRFLMAHLTLVGEFSGSL